MSKPKSDYYNVTVVTGFLGHQEYKITRKFGNAWMGNYSIDCDLDYVLKALEKSDIKAIVDVEFEKAILR